jgi:23S rRNA (cytosine1962-C5)-methyltransferase
MTERTSPLASGSSERASVQLAADARLGGPWIFARQVRDPGAAQDGELVEVRDERGQFLGHALFNSRSDIRLRLLSRGKKSSLDDPRRFLLETLARADRLRRKVLRLEQQGNAYRVAHAEGDDLPGLIVDRLGDWLVCEHHALGFYRLRQAIEWALAQLYPRARVVHRFPGPAARAEGCEELAEARAEEGAPEPTELIENGLTFVCSPGVGHKTGWFCDQRENRARVAHFAAGRDVLDLFCNAGGFALNAARAGARSVRGVDLDEKVLERARASAQRNDLEVAWRHADAFDVLREAAASPGSRPGLIVVDPHKLIPSKQAEELGLAKYRDLNTLAIAAVRSEGLVATFSCSGLLSEPSFVGLLFACARRAGRELKLLERFEAGPDHPQRPDFARSRYLKGALLAVD